MWIWKNLLKSGCRCRPKGCSPSRFFLRQGRQSNSGPGTNAMPQRCLHNCFQHTLTPRHMLTIGRGVHSLIRKHFFALDGCGARTCRNRQGQCMGCHRVWLPHANYPGLAMSRCGAKDCMYTFLHSFINLPLTHQMSDAPQIGFTSRFERFCCLFVYFGPADYGWMKASCLMPGWGQLRECVTPSVSITKRWAHSPFRIVARS